MALKHVALGKPQPWYPGINRQHSIGKDCVLCYPFWDVSSERLTDVSGTGRDADLSATNINSTGSPYGYSLGTPTTSWTDVPHPIKPWLNTEDGVMGSDITMLGVIATTGSSDIYLACHSLAPSTTDRTELATGASAVRFRHRQINGTNRLVDGNTATVSGQWYAIAGRARSDEISVWLDGRKDGIHGSGGYTGSWSGTSYQADIGRSPAGGSTYIGAIAFLAVINRALSDTEIASWSADPWLFCRPSMTRRTALLHVAPAGGVTMPRFYHHYQRNTG